MRQTALDMVYELAKRDPRVVFIGSDLGAGTLDKMREEMPDRFFMEGIAEQNVIGMAAGLAMDGFIPYINSIATFMTRRCHEQVAIDVCLHNLPVRVIASGGGLVYAPLGPTHEAIEDVALMRALPNMTVVAPADKEEMRRLMPQTLDWKGPMYVRFGKGGDPVITTDADDVTIGRARLVRPMGDILIVSTGVMTKRCLDAAELLAAQGVSAGVLHMPTIKPLDAATLHPLAAKAKLVVTVEEHTLIGGLGSAVIESLVDAGGAMPRVLRLGLADAFQEGYGSQDDLLRKAGLMPEQIAGRIQARLAGAI